MKIPYRSVLSVLSVDRLVRLGRLAMLCALPGAAMAATYDLSWNVIAGGGTSSAAGGAYTLGATIGQASTSQPGGGAYTLNSGFWQIETTTTPSLVQALSRKSHGGAGTFDLMLAATPLNPTTEPRVGSPAGAHMIVFQFDAALASGTAAVTAGTGVAGAPTFSGSEMIVPITGVANVQYVTVAVSDVASTGGGTGGGGSVRVGFLAGDVNGSRAVTLSDLLSVNAALSQTVTAANFLRDVNQSGTLTLADKLLVNSNLTKALPTP